MSISTEIKIDDNKTQYLHLSCFRVLSIIGPDSKDFLQRMCTADLRTQRVQPGAFLTGKGGLVSYGYFIPVKGGIQYCVEEPFAEEAYQHLDKIHFSEQLELKWEPISVVAIVYSQSITRLEFMNSDSRVLNQFSDFKMTQLDYLFVETSHLNSFLSDLRKKDWKALSFDEFNLLRLKAGIPRPAVEAKLGSLILELSLDWAVSRNKGCYPGQEVVERIFTYGSVNRKLLPVVLEGPLDSLSKGKDFLDSSDASSTALLFDGKQIGALVSCLQEGTNSERAFGLAMIDKPYWDLKESFSGPLAPLRVRLL